MYTFTGFADVKAESSDSTRRLYGRGKHQRQEAAWTAPRRAVRAVERPPKRHLDFKRDKLDYRCLLCTSLFFLFSNIKNENRGPNTVIYLKREPTRAGGGSLPLPSRGAAPGTPRSPPPPLVRAVGCAPVCVRACVGGGGGRVREEHGFSRGFPMRSPTKLFELFAAGCELPSRSPPKKGGGGWNGGGGPGTLLYLTSGAGSAGGAPRGPRGRLGPRALLSSGARQEHSKIRVYNLEARRDPLKKKS